MSRHIAIGSQSSTESSRYTFPISLSYVSFHFLTNLMNRND